MFIHPNDRFHESRMHCVNNRQLSQNDAQQQVIPISMDLTMRAIRAYVKRHKLKIKCSGKGRTKAKIVKDIKHLMNAQTKDKDTNKRNHKTCSIPFAGFDRCCFNLALLENVEIDSNKLRFEWMSNTKMNEQIIAISVLITGQNEWAFGENDFESQFLRCFECTKNKFDKGMLAQKCVGGIVAIYERSIIGCMLMHRLPILDNENAANYKHSIMDIRKNQIMQSSKLSQQIKDVIAMKNSYLLIESFCIYPSFNQQYEFIANKMFGLLFRSYPNDLFLGYVSVKMRMFGNKMSLFRFAKDLL